MYVLCVDFDSSCLGLPLGLLSIGGPYILVFLWVFFPSVFLLGALIAAIVLPALPLMLTHVATEDRLSAAFELRRLWALRDTNPRMSCLGGRGFGVPNRQQRGGLCL